MGLENKEKWAKKWFRCKDHYPFELREMLWHPTKNMIEDWVESKTLEFAQEESTGSQLSVGKWVDEYIYFDIHEVFFAEFPIVLHEWLSILARRQTNFQRRETVKWNDQLVHEVTSVSNTISRAVDFWVDSILQGYITVITPKFHKNLKFLR